MAAKKSRSASRSGGVGLEAEGRREAGRTARTEAAVTPQKTKPAATAR